MKKVVKVYSKVCLECVDEKWLNIKNKLLSKYIVKEYRTALNPIWHMIASNLYGSRDYEPFIVLENGLVKTVKDLEGEYEKENMQKMRGKATKHNRVASLSDKASKIKNKVKRKVK